MSDRKLIMGLPGQPGSWISRLYLRKVGCPSFVTVVCPFSFMVASRCREHGVWANADSLITEPQANFLLAISLASIESSSRS